MKSGKYVQREGCEKYYAREAMNPSIVQYPARSSILPPHNSTCGFPTEFPTEFPIELQIMR
jgi:hypothetical protein